MLLKDIVSSISASESIPAGQVRKVALALFEKMDEAVNTGEKFYLGSKYILIPRTIRALEAKDDKPARPEFKTGVFRRRPIKQADDQQDQLVN